MPDTQGHATGADERHVVAAEPVSFEDVLGLAEASPYPSALREAAAEKQGRDRTARRLTQGPQILVMPGARVAPAPNRGFEFQASVMQPWSLEHYGRRRLETARAETEVLQVRARAVALEQRLAAAHAWVQLWAAEHQLALVEAQLEIRRGSLERLREAQVGGVATFADVAQGEAKLAATEATVVAARGMVHDRGLRLAAELARGGQVLRTSGEPPDPVLPSERELASRFAEVHALPQVALARLTSRWERARAVEAKAAAGTTMSAGMAVQREGTTDVLVFGSVGVQVPWSRAQTTVASHLAQARIAEGEEAMLRQRLAAQLGTVLHELQHTRRRLQVLRERVLPAAEALVAAREAAMSVGETTWVLLLDAQDQHAEARLAEQDAAAAWLWARIEAWLYLELFLDAGGQG